MILEGTMCNDERIHVVEYKLQSGATRYNLMKYSIWINRRSWHEIYDLNIMTAYCLALNIRIYCNCASNKYISEPKV